MRDLWLEKLNIFQLYRKRQQNMFTAYGTWEFIFFLPNFAEVETNFSFVGVNTADWDLIQ